MSIGTVPFGSPVILRSDLQRLPPFGGCIQADKALRQIYLFLATHYLANTPTVVALGYPVGWVMCFIIVLAYCRRKGLLGRRMA